MHVSLRGACAVLCMAGIAMAVRAQEPTWVGTYVGQDSSDEVIRSAIETAVAEMGLLTRSVARGRLKKTNPAYRRIELARSADAITVKFDDREPIEMPADGTAIKWTREDGEVFDVTAQALSGGLVQTFEAQDGRRTNAFSVDDAGRMTLEVEVRSPRLPAPLSYVLHYVRTPD